MASGKFIVIEGVDGAGTTTQVELLARALKSGGCGVVRTAEPSCGPVGVLVRSVLAGKISREGRGEVDEKTLALLFAADRADHLCQVVRPALEKGFHVISDRHYLSSFAYQSVELELAWVRQLNVHCGPPDLAILLDAPVEVCLGRINSRSAHIELYETVERLRRVRRNYLAISDVLRSEGETIVTLDATATVDEVHCHVLEAVRGCLGGLGHGRAQGVRGGPTAE